MAAFVDTLSRPGASRSISTDVKRIDRVAHFDPLKETSIEQL
ncbi:hypothetical protein HTIA_1032 [Halorhabdus tiamatea SARL4B]|uniref:Uncharacterized protein n=1 Tax=Halorhabdus tiamatea SARL4B TaxID=1033806 RepID=S6D2E5_9EURY|nr:hypothetical protein HTIA_1032 [Halorhabdus tiamatea SARL4B]